jgi:hypothetical protein
LAPQPNWRAVTDRLSVNDFAKHDAQRVLVATLDLAIDSFATLTLSFDESQRITQRQPCL